MSRLARFHERVQRTKSPGLGDSPRYGICMHLGFVILFPSRVSDGVPFRPAVICVQCARAFGKSSLQRGLPFCPTMTCIPGSGIMRKRPSSEPINKSAGQPYRPARCHGSSQGIPIPASSLRSLLMNTCEFVHCLVCGMICLQAKPCPATASATIHRQVATKM